MRTTEERTRLVHQRTAELKKEQCRRKNRLVGTVCTAACLLLVTALGLWMPQLAAVQQGSSTLTGAASLVASHGALGYILMGILSFLLGVCVTVLLYRLRRRTEHQHSGEEDHEL